MQRLFRIIFLNRSLIFKIGVATITPLLLSWVLSIVIGLDTLQSSVQKDFYSESYEKAAKVANSLADADHFYSKDFLTGTIKLLNEVPNIVFSMVLDSDSRYILNHSNPGLNAQLFDQSLTHQKDTLNVSSPVIINETQVGLVIIGISTEGIIDVAGLEENKMPVESEEFDLVKLIDETKEMYSAELGQIGGTLLTEFDGPVNSIAGRRLVQRLLQNLLANSLKFTKPNGMPHIILRALTGPKNVVFSVTDNGSGIARKFHKDVFSRFFRVESGETASLKGLGLGLTFCKLAAEAVNGHISLVSREGHGATFTITLPSAV